MGKGSGFKSAGALERGQQVNVSVNMIQSIQMNANIGLIQASKHIETEEGNGRAEEIESLIR
jgi:hypothetical protein